MTFLTLVGRESPCNAPQSALWGSSGGELSLCHTTVSCQGSSGWGFCRTAWQLSGGVRWWWRWAGCGLKRGHAVPPSKNISEPWCNGIGLVTWPGEPTFLLSFLHLEIMATSSSCLSPASSGPTPQTTGWLQEGLKEYKGAAGSFQKGPSLWGLKSLFVSFPLSVKERQACPASSHF